VYGLIIFTVARKKSLEEDPEFAAVESSHSEKAVLAA
jgi:hypothetical protein